MKNIMTRAWEIAREAVERFGGKAVEYIAGALKQAWNETKRGVDKMKKENGLIKTNKTKTIEYKEKGLTLELTYSYTKQERGYGTAPFERVGKSIVVNGGPIKNEKAPLNKVKDINKMNYDINKQIIDAVKAQGKQHYIQTNERFILIDEDVYNEIQAFFRSNQEENQEPANNKQEKINKEQTNWINQIEESLHQEDMGRRLESQF